MLEGVTRVEPRDWQCGPEDAMNGTEEGASRARSTVYVHSIARFGFWVRCSVDVYGCGLHDQREESG